MSTGGTTGTPISSSFSSGSGYGPDIGQIRPIMPAEEWMRYHAIHPAHFYQMKGVNAPTGRGCDKVWDQDDRNQLNEYIKIAEDMIRTELGYSVGPEFFTDEEIMYGYDSNIRHRRAPVKTRWGNVIDYGVEKLTLVKSDAVVTYYNRDADPEDVPETAVIGTSLYDWIDPCANPNDVAIFFRVADGAIDAAHSSWEIRDFTVDIDGDQMYIRMPAPYLLKPSLRALTRRDVRHMSEDEAWIHSYVTDNLVTAVDIYCRTTDSTTPVSLLWSKRCECLENPCQHSTQTGCPQDMNNRIGSFVPVPATWNGSKHIIANYAYFGIPEKLKVNYRAGLPLARDGRLNPLIRRAIIKLTNVMMPAPACGLCDYAKSLYENDREPVSQLTVESANVPWGLYQRGAVEAWRIIHRFIQE